MEETVLRRRTRRRDLSAAEAEAMLLDALRRRAAETCGEIRTERWQTETLAGAFRTEYTFGQTLGKNNAARNGETDWNRSSALTGSSL